MYEGGERARDDRGDRDPVEDETRPVVDEALALDDRHELARDAEATCDRGRGERVGGRDDRAEHERARPTGARRSSACATTATPTVVTTTSPTASSPIGRDVRSQVAERREEGGAVEQRRQDAEEDELRLELELGHSGNEADRAARRATSRIGYGIRSVGAIASIAATSDEERQRDESVLEIEVHRRIVPTPTRYERDAAEATSRG